MYSEAILKDDLIETLSAIENEPKPVTVPGDEPINSPDQTILYESGKNNDADIELMMSVKSTTTTKINKEKTTTSSSAVKVTKPKSVSNKPAEQLGAGSSAASYTCSKSLQVMMLVFVYKILHFF